MQVPINFRSAELLSCSLCQSITDAMAQAGADAEDTLPKLREASMFAHELARFLDSLAEGISAEVVVEPRTPSLHGIEVKEHQVPAFLREQAPALTPVRHGWPEQFSVVQDSVAGSHGGDNSAA